MRSIVLALLLSTLFACPYIAAGQHKGSTVKSRLFAFTGSAALATETESEQERAGAENGTTSHTASIHSIRRASSLFGRSSTLPSSNATTPPYPPTPSPTYSPQYRGMDSSSSIDVLVAALFLIAAGWLVLAIIYSVLIICVVRMRARGDLDVYDERFGRVYFCCSCYLPLGCLLRRHILALHRAQEQSQNVRVMARTERRHAMEQLLGRAAVAESVTEEHERGKEALSGGERSSTYTTSNEDRQGDLESCEGQEPLCSICLMEYEENDICLTSPTCVHRFHHECLMDWLERQNNTDCPCCREAMVADDDVWDLVQASRRKQRKLRRIQSTKGMLAWFCCACAPCRPRSHTDEQAHPTSSENDDDDDVEQGLDQAYVQTTAPVPLGPMEVAQEPIAPFPLLPDGLCDEDEREILTVDDHEPSDTHQSELIDEYAAECSSGLAIVPDDVPVEHAAEGSVCQSMEDDRVSAEGVMVEIAEDYGVPCADASCTVERNVIDDRNQEDALP